MGSRRTRWGVVVTALALTLLATSVLATGSVAQTPTLRVAVIGDSVLLGAKEELLAQFAGQPVSVDAVEDRSLLGAIGLFRSAGPALGDVVVLDLGYNDSSDPVVFRGRIDEAMTALAAVPHVIWLNQHDWGPGRAGMNAELTAAAARYPNLEVIDWNAEVAAHPDYVYADAIHLTPAGQPAMAAVVRERYDRYVASLTPTTTAAPTTTSTTRPSTTRPSTTSGTGARAASAVAADDADHGRRDLVLAGGGVVVLLLVVGTVVSVGRRARPGARRGR